MKKQSDKVGPGSILEDFELVSYDKDSGRILSHKTFDDGSEWLEPVAISIPDLFHLFRTEGVDPTEMADEPCFEFHKAKIEIGDMITTTYAEDDDLYSDTYYHECRAVRQ
ncbi:MAG: hypothetical protein IKQ15_05670 [Kiritimatiellae bacterium]|nr:hypothetical protein [Kiritimatiellia bacterium]